MLGDEVFKQTLIELKRIRFTDSQVMRERERERERERIRDKRRGGL